jgi:fatty acid desaturase
MTNFSVFRLSVDRIPVAIILSITLLDFLIFFTAQSITLLAAYWLIMIIPRGVICAWNHHHQHLSVFKNKSLNRILEFFYALHTGVTTNLWFLHHNVGHHRNYLDQEKDQSRWKRKDGSTMGIFEYTAEVTLTAYYRGYQAGKDYPKQRKQFVRYSAITILILLGLTLYNPVNAIFIFILPMITSLIYTARTTYDHHAGIDTQDQFAASNNITSTWYNWFTGNLGFHTAHHYKQGIHWSVLPELHEQIKHKIPPARILSSKFP